MENISCKAELQDAIQLLEAEQTIKLKLMKEDFRRVYGNLNPANLVNSTLKEISTSPYFVSAAVGLATGYVSKKAITGWANNKFTRLLGVFLQFGITSLIGQNPQSVRSLREYISHHIFNKED